METGTTGASVYVHFPHCLEKCPYCDFVSYKTEREHIDHAGYADAVLRELEARAPAFDGRLFGSVFFGGGTPSLWEPRELGRVIEGVRDRFEVAEDLEVTVECNPTSIDGERAARLADAGVNRLSIGVQSLRDSELRFLGRLHDAAGALRAVREAVASPVERVSADLIFGVPEQTPEAAAAQATALAELGLRHLSCYQLTIEPGTRFGELARRGRLPRAEDAVVAEAFSAIEEALASRGLLHYEISNYATAGQEARHNLGYWRGEEYLGLGCAAYGFVRTERGERGATGVRWRNEISPEKYVQSTRSVRTGVPSREDGLSTSCEVLDAQALLRERIMLGLRVRGGFDLAAAADELGIDSTTRERERALGWLVERGRLERRGTRLAIPPAAWLFADDTAARLF